MVLIQLCFITLLHITGRSQKMEMLTALIYVVLPLLLIIYIYTKWAYSYWKRRGVYYIEPEFPYGNVKNFVKRFEFVGDTFRKHHEQFKSRGIKGGGYFMFFKPIFMAVDLDLIKNILQKDFDHFVNHGRYFNKKVDPLTGHLFNMENEEWKNLRMKLTPTFTSGK